MFLVCFAREKKLTKPKKSKTNPNDPTPDRRACSEQKVSTPLGQITIYSIDHLLLRGALVNRTCGRYKNQYFYLFTKNIWSYLLWSPVIVPHLYLAFFVRGYCTGIINDCFNACHPAICSMSFNADHSKPSWRKKPPETK